MAKGFESTNSTWQCRRCGELNEENASRCIHCESRRPNSVAAFQTQHIVTSLSPPRGTEDRVEIEEVTGEPVPSEDWSSEEPPAIASPSPFSALFWDLAFYGAGHLVQGRYLRCLVWWSVPIGWVLGLGILAGKGGDNAMVVYAYLVVLIRFASAIDAYKTAHEWNATFVRLWYESPRRCRDLREAWCLEDTKKMVAGPISHRVSVTVACILVTFLFALFTSRR